ncbi:hypothetical protein EJB05_18372, partial [Eragrostis curvula]
MTLKRRARGEARGRRRRRDGGAAAFGSSARPGGATTPLKTSRRRRKETDLAFETHSSSSGYGSIPERGRVWEDIFIRGWTTMGMRGILFFLERWPLQTTQAAGSDATNARPANWGTELSASVDSIHLCSVLCLGEKL